MGGRAPGVYIGLGLDCRADVGGSDGEYSGLMRRRLFLRAFSWLGGGSAMVIVQGSSSKGSSFTFLRGVEL